MITDGEVDAAAEALVPFSFGAFEWQTMPDGTRVQPAMQPNDHAKKAARAALEAAAKVRDLQEAIRALKKPEETRDSV